MAWGITLIVIGGLVTVFTLFGLILIAIGTCFSMAGLDVLA